MLHQLRDRHVASASDAIDAGADEEVRVGFVRRGEQLEDVAFAVADVDDARGFVCGCRLPEILDPADAFLFLDRDSRRVDRLLAAVNAPFEGIRPLELLTGPELHGQEPERFACRRHRQAGVHQQPALRDRLLAETTGW